MVVAYVEEFKDGRAFLEACRRVIASGKHVVLVAPYGSEAVARSVSSHTGSLVSSDAIIDAAASLAGIVRVSSIAEMMLALEGLQSPARAHGRRLAVLSDGGGCATIATGVAGREGFTVPAFSDTLKEQLKTVCTPESGIGNPVDYVKALDIEVFVPVAEMIARSGEVDAILMSGFFNNVLPEIDPVREQGHAKRILSAVTAHGLGLAIATVEPNQPAMELFKSAGVLRVRSSRRCGAQPAARLGRRPDAWLTRRTPARPSPSAQVPAISKRAHFLPARGSPSPRR